MAQWDWTRHTWACEREACGHRDNPALANFCAVCGEPAGEKLANRSAPLPLGEGGEPKKRPVLLRNADLLLNIFGVALVIDRKTGKMISYPNPLLEGQNFNLPSVSSSGALRQVVFDRWCLYVLDAQDRVWCYPVPALSDEMMAREAKWWLWCEGAERILLHRGYLLTISSEGRCIQTWKIGPDVSKVFWADTERGSIPPAFAFERLPFRVESVVSMRGDGLLLGLIGQQEVALLSKESGIHGHDQTFRPEGSRTWIGTNFQGLPKVAAVHPNGDIFSLSFIVESNRTLREVLGNDPRGMVLSIDVDGGDWFLVITTTNIKLIDPLNLYRGASEQPIFTGDAQLYSSFGDLVVGPQINRDRMGTPLFSVFSAERNGGLRQYRFWSLDSGFKLSAPPAGFGHSLYLLGRQANALRLICYDLSNIRTAN